MKTTEKKKKKTFLYALIVVAVLLIKLATGTFQPQDLEAITALTGQETAVSQTPAQNDELPSSSPVQGTAPPVSAPISPEDIPEYSGDPYVVLNNNLPDFTEEDKTTASFEIYGELDSLGRCTTAYANVGYDLMPTEKRGNISSVKPTGWHSVQYDHVDGKSLYNRCHLIGFQLTGENANKKNLITGTRYLNVEGMLDRKSVV